MFLKEKEKDQIKKMNKKRKYVHLLSKIDMGRPEGLASYLKLA